MAEATQTLGQSGPRGGRGLAGQKASDNALVEAQEHTTAQGLKGSRAARWPYDGMARKEKASRKTGVAGWEPWQMVVVHDTGAVETGRRLAVSPPESGGAGSVLLHPLSHPPHKTHPREAMCNCFTSPDMCSRLAPKRATYSLGARLARPLPRECIIEPMAWPSVDVSPW
ncbi:hypothetical protein COCC4DRAFT_60242 [Bipolaris maydis ATCC 48331]|uniref:Uncharacterized protein n=1 Tax=Cochliobolus heterostrophus (strain C4 / ATCC 48331 / race T) TaxID=665024 RepID=N4XHF7_COCH4|nr:uncharacterized protein COCC4DRAFT_60242 [Bipolaris maydis ATCC 48331]ENI05976.1 hypothetical protein COCC4DRAFT_60242 [Bipolaris maydis ATCC 48331]